MSDIFTFKVEVFTDNLLITGSYDLPFYRRLSDAINSRIHRFVSLRDASVAPLGKHQQSQRVPQLLVDLSGALLVAVIEEPLPPPDFATPAPVRDTQPMMFFTSAFAIRADFYKRSDMELIATLSEMHDDFIPLAKVVIFPLNGGAALNRDFVCLSRSHIQALFALAVPPPPAPAAPPDVATEPVEEPTPDAAEQQPPEA